MSAVSLVVSNPEPLDAAQEMWLKRQAIGIAAQLPEDRDKALRVLAYAQRLITEFMSEP